MEDHFKEETYKEQILNSLMLLQMESYTLLGQITEQQIIQINYTRIISNFLDLFRLIEDEEFQKSLLTKFTDLILDYYTKQIQSPFVNLLSNFLIKKEELIFEKTMVKLVIFVI